jgi:hypothetical protein
MMATPAAPVTAVPSVLPRRSPNTAAFGPAGAAG